MRQRARGAWPWFGVVTAMLLAALALTCGDEDAPAPPGESCKEGFCVKRASGELVGVSWPVLCADSYCKPVTVSCGKALHVSAVAGAGGDGSSGAPFRALAAAAKVASDGDCVLVGPGTYLGTKFSGGVKLLGAGASSVSIKPASGAARNLSLQGGKGALVRGVSITGAAVGLYISGASGVRVEQVRIHDAAGAGLYATGAAGLTMKQVAVTGVKVQSGAAMGVVLLDKTTATLRGALLDKNGQLGLVAQGAALDMATAVVRGNGGGGGAGAGGMIIACDDRKVTDCAGALASKVDRVDLQENLGIALLAAAAKLDLSNLEVRKTGLGGGASRGISVHGKGLASMTLSLKGSTISDGAGQGIVVDVASGEADDPDQIFFNVVGCTVSGNKDRGVWLQRLGAAKGSVTLDQNKISGNMLMGLGGLKVKGVTVKGGAISGTKKTVVVAGGVSLEMGDGLQVMDQSAVTVSGVAFANNERISLLFDGSSGKVTGNSFSPATGAKAFVLQNGADKGVTASGNKDSAGAEVKGEVPPAAFGLSKTLLATPALPALP